MATQRMTDVSDTYREVCYRCFKAAAVCICSTVVPVDNRTFVHIIQHPRERHRAIGTARFAELGLLRCAVEVLAPRGGIPSTLATTDPSKLALLYPGAGARDIESLEPSERPETLIVLDGTWSQAVGLKLANPWLNHVPHVTFRNPAPSRYRIRAEPKADYLSTIESIVLALSALEPDTVGLTGLTRAFDEMIDTQLAYIRSHHAPRFIKRDRAKPDRSLRHRLRTERDRQVLVYVETIGRAPPYRPLQVCAWRVATGETLECLVRPSDGWPSKVTHLGWHPEDRLSAIDDAEMEARMGDFLRNDDVLVAWRQRSPDALPPTAASAPLILKGAVAERGRATGDLGVLTGRLGLTAHRTPFCGRAAQHMGQALALLEHLSATPADHVQSQIILT